MSMEYVAPLYKLELVRQREIPFQSGTTTEQRVSYLRNLFEKSVVEEFAVVYLSSSGQILGSEIIAAGSVDSVQVNLPKIFRGAIVSACSSIVIAHCHLSDSAEPSFQDISLTRSAIEMGSFLKVPVRDHIIIASLGGYIAMSENPHFLSESTT